MFYCLKLRFFDRCRRVETKNYAIATSSEYFEYVAAQDRFASDSDYLLYRLDCLVYHLNHYSPVLEFDDVILTTVLEARMAMALLSSHEHSFVALRTVVRITSSNSNTVE